MDFKIGMAQEQFLNQVEDRLAHVLRLDDALLPQSADVLAAAARHLCVTGNAKRARPLLTLFFGNALGLEHDKLVAAAVAGELIHSASLLHDDVVDDAKTRRGRPTVNYHWNNSIAVLAGNSLLSVAFSLLKEGPRQLINDAVDVISHMTKAASAEIAIRSRLDVSTEHWREIAIGKTGALFAWCGLAAARISGDDEAARRFQRCGLHIGVAFQLADDVRDLQDKNALKDRFSDIKNREPSFPILLSLQTPSIRAEIEKLWALENMSDSEILRIGNLVLDCGAAEKTCLAMKAEVDAAEDALGIWADRAGGQNISYWLKQLCRSAHDGFSGQGT